MVKLRREEDEGQLEINSRKNWVDSKIVGNVADFVEGALG
jgi:hypothetical protein